MRSLTNGRLLWKLSKLTLHNKCKNVVAAATVMPKAFQLQQRKYGDEKKSNDNDKCDDEEGNGGGDGGGSKQKLLKYPVLPLTETLDRFMLTVQPLLTPDAFEEQKKITEEFADGEGKKLQKLLEEVGSQEKNWLAPRWLKAAYMQYRDPVTVFSSPGMTFPMQCFPDIKTFLEYTAKVIYGLGEFKLMVDEGNIPVVKMGKNELDNSQFGKVFGTCRIPKRFEDELVYNPKSNYVVVIYNNHFYKMPIYDQSNALVKPSALAKQLEKIMRTELEPGPPYGLLTTDTRDNWAEAYEHVMKVKGNCEAVQTVQESLFTVSLDKCFDIPPGQENNQLAAQLIHGGGEMLNGANRWMDKTIQLIVNPNGIVGFCYEHSPAEGQPIAMMMDYVVKKMEECGDSFGQDGVEDGFDEAEKIKFAPFNPCIDIWMMVAKRTVDKLAKTLQLHVLKFGYYGKEFIKSQKLGPDSYIQIAIQLAFYKIHKVPGAQYESAHLRIFEGGRTETIRSCSLESLDFVVSIFDEGCTDKKRVELLRKAVNAHQAYTRLALNGKGVDRHLLGLKLMAVENCEPSPEFFQSPGYVKSSHFRLSTSQVATSYDAFMCYGPATTDGYGCCYNPRDCDLIFAISTWTMDQSTDPLTFAKELDWALTRMYELLSGGKLCKL